jgi:hypothetical protein
MAYHQKAAKIRQFIRLYTTQSVLTHLLRHLHEPPRPIEQGPSMPWIICLALEWTIELTPVLKAKEATEQNVYKVLQMLWELQNSALDLDSPDFMVQIRKMLITQTRFQEEKHNRFLFLYRFIAILSLQNGRQWLSKDFEDQACISLEKFLILSTWLLVRFSFINNHFVKYETIINELYPAFTVDEIALFLKIVGGTLPQLKNTILSARPSSRKLYQSEYFEEPVLISRPVILLNDGISTMDFPDFARHF